MARKLAYFLVFAAFWVPGSIFALGLGEIKLNSALNQPLDAEIQLVSATEQDMKGLEAGVASPDIFDRYGLERNAFILGLMFNIEKKPDGAYVLRVRSTQSISEPFLSFLVEVNWSRGRLLREYTVLLDPPIFLPDENIAAAPVAAPQQSTAAQVTTETVTRGTVLRSIPEPPPAAQAAPTVSPQPQVQPEAQPGPQTRSIAPQSRPLPEAQAPDQYMVQRNDTLWEIAERNRHAQGVDVNQMMIAIFDANPNAFMGNINLMKAGVILRIPDLSQYAGIDRGDARAEVARQIAAWRSGQGHSAGSGRLRLIPAEDVSEPVAGTSVADEATREAFADASVENAQLRGEISALQERVDDQERALQLADSELAILQQQLADQAATVAESLDEIADDTVAGDDFTDDVFADTAVVPDDMVLGTDDIAGDMGDDGFAEDSGPDAGISESDDLVSADDIAADAADEVAGSDTAVPVSEIPAVVTPTQSEPSIVEKIMGLLGNSMVWIAAGLVFLLMMAVVFFRRRAGSDVTEDWDQLTAGGDVAALKEDTGTASLAALERADEEESFVVVESAHEEDTAEIEEVDEYPDATVSQSTAELQATLSDEVDKGGDTGLDFTATADISIEETGIEEVNLEDTFSSETAINLDQADPVAEADFHMAYGLYDQAADLVKKASEVDPEDRSLKLKLLEIYFVWGNKDAFLATANELQASGDQAADGEWDKILIMGKQICPDSDLFSGAPGAAMGTDAAVDLELEATQVAVVDIDTETGEIEALSEDSVIDLDLGDALAMPESDDIKLSETGETLLSEDEMLDLDAAGSELGAELDLGASTMESPTVESPAADHQGTDLDLDLGDSIEESPVRADQTAEVEVDDLGLDLDKIGATGEFALSDMEDEGTGETQISPDAPTMIAKVDETMALDDPTKIALEAFEDDSAATSHLRALTGDDEDVDLDLGATAETKIAESDIDLDLEDLTQAIAAGDTAEMPTTDDDIFGSGETESGVDLDLGDALDEDSEADTGTMPVAEDIDLDIGGSVDVGAEPTATQEMPGEEGANDDTRATEALKMPDPDVGMTEGEAETMSEVGTKLDLARAYMDMGDPDGASSILKEVLDEGDDAQKQEAQKLLDSLP